MKKWAMRFTPETVRLVSKLHPNHKKQVKQALDGLRQNPNAGKDLQGELIGFKSLRSGRHRIIYDIDEEAKFVQVYHIGVRRDVYAQFQRLLHELRKSSSRE
ncbi:MAG: type II toxin-antitoxin system RelE/ParE family toxin [Desulfobacterales bacterium]